MGEAKRRKKLEPNFGKIPKTVQESGLNVFLMGDLGKKCYENYGRGILFNQPGEEPKYALSNCSWLQESERDSLENYNPKEQVLIAELIGSKNSVSRIVGAVSISKANQLRVISPLTTVEELASKIFVATADNEPK